MSLGAPTDAGLGIRVGHWVGHHRGDDDNQQQRCGTDHVHGSFLQWLVDTVGVLWKQQRSFGVVGDEACRDREGLYSRGGAARRRHS